MANPLSDLDAAASLPPRLRRLLAPDTAFFGRVRTNAAETRGLQRLLAAGRAAGGNLNLARAMYIAADNAPTSETAASIGRILNDQEAEPALRRHAAACLGDMDTRAASKALTEALVDAPAALEAAVLTALAKVGDADAARVLALGGAGTPRLRRLRAIARAMIAWRRGDRTDAVAEAALLPATRVLPLHALPEAELRRVRQDLRGSTYGTAPSAELAYGWVCQGERARLLFSAAIARGRIVSALRSGPQVAGLIVIPEEPGARTWVVHRIVVTRPEADHSVSVAVIGASGEIEATGSLRPAAGNLNLLLHSRGPVLRPYALHGHVDENGLELSALLSDASVTKLTGDVDPAAA